MNEFRTFIASSLKPEFLEHRLKIVEALQSLNQDPELQPLNFSSYRFETEGSNASCVGGIQNNINLAIEECHGFVLICDSNIGLKTVEEFEKALSRFNRYQNPSFLIILKSKVHNPCGTNQITFEKFKTDYLTLFDYNHDGKINDDVVDYEFEFDDIDKACDKLKKDLKEWLTHKDNRPLFKAELGRDITPEFLYKDEKRIKGCDDRMYFRRDFDDMLDKAIEEKEPVILIKGASLSGKTRALYQAIKNSPNSWFYKFKERHDMARIILEIKEIAEYMEFSKTSMPLCLIFDDIHQMPSSEEMRNAVERLMDAVHRKGVSIIMTSTSTDDLFIPATKILKIKSLSRKECAEAEIFFRRFGKLVETEYREIGAMMIDLKGIKVSYDCFRNDTDARVARSKDCLLDAIKAFSIWHSSNIGNVRNLFAFTKYLLSCETEPSDKPYPAEDSIQSLLKLPGINQDVNAGTFKSPRRVILPEYIQIEEYIYRYILDHLSVEDEWCLMNVILSFVKDNKSDNNSESLIVCLSKLARRAENQHEIAHIIYDLVMSIYSENKVKCPSVRGSSLSSESWYRQLEEEIAQIKSEVEANPLTENEECSDGCIYMSKIVWVRMLYADSYEDAERIFNSVPFPLQNLPMLGALIVKSAGNQEKLNEIVAKRNVDDSFYIINKMIPYASDFDEALAYFNKGKLRYDSEPDYIESATELKSLQEKRSIQGEMWNELKFKDITRQHFILALNSLALKVRRLDDLNKLLEIIRDNYVYLLDNLEYASDFCTSSDKYSKDKLTMVDLLSCLNFYGLRGAFTNVMNWGKQIPSELSDFSDRLILAYAQTSRQTTIGYKAKQTVSTIFNVFIEKCCECQYEDVMENIFRKMYVQRGTEMVNLCDSYTYSGMMRNKHCKYIDALDLYNNFIEPHSKDPEGHFLITHFILNEILNKVRSASEYNRVNRIFLENNVTKDIYTYNNVLRNLTYSVGVTQILPQMRKEGVEMDIYTIGTLISKSPNIRIAASYFYPLFRIGIKSEDNMVPHGDLKKMVDAKIKEYTKDLPLESQHYLWATLVESYCRNDEDREVLLKILEYLEKSENRSRIFGERDNGIIYNNCLKNRSFIRNYEEAADFILSKNITPDSYTLGQLIKIIISDFKDETEYEQDVTQYLNEIFKENKQLVIRQLQENNTYLYNERLRAYKSYAEKLSFVFIFPNGKEDEIALNPMEYISYLLLNGLPFDQYTLSCFAEIPKGQSYQLLKDFLVFVKANNLYVNHYAIDSLVKHFKEVIPEQERVTALGAIYELPIKDDIISQGMATVNMYAHGLCSLRDAFERVEGNHTEKLYCYTQLLSLFRKFQLEQRQTIESISQDFRFCMELYTEFVKNKQIIPNSDLFSNLANFATNRAELEEVFGEMRIVKVQPISYMLTPILRVSGNIADIKTLIQEYIDLGGAIPGREGSQTEVDAILRGLGILWRKTKDYDIHELITGLTEYVLSSSPSSSVLKEIPAFKIYKDGGDNLTQNALCELVNCWPKMEDDSIVNAKYLENISNLLTKYYRPDNDAVRPKLVKAIIYVISKRGISSVDILKVLKPYPRLAFMFASQQTVDGYDAYKMLIESWNDGFDRISQEYAIDVLLTQLESSETLVGVAEQILIGIYKKWKISLSTADFLKPGDTMQSEASDVTEYTENDRLRRKYLKSRYNLFANRGNYTKESRVNLFIKLFRDELSDVSFIKSEFGVFVKQNKLKFDEIKPILDTVTGNKDSVCSVLCYLADKLDSYSNLYYIVARICSESVTISEELAQKLVFGVMRKRYDDYKFGLVAGQIFRAIEEERLQLADLLYVPTTLPREALQRRLKLSKDQRSLYRLLDSLSHGMTGLSSSEMIEHAEELICRYYLGLHEGKSLIDSLVVQELLRLYVVAYNKREGKEYESVLLRKIQTIMSVPIFDKVDTSILFSEGSKDKLGKKSFWYTVTSGYISRMILASLNCSDEKKMDMVISSVSQDFWWSKAFRGNFAKLLNYAEHVEARIDDSKPEEFMHNLFKEAQNPEDFIQALKVILSGRIKYCNEIDVINSMLRIIGKEEEYVYRIVGYNDMLYRKHGKRASLIDECSTWKPDADFFNVVFGIGVLDESADPMLSDLFQSMVHMKPVARFVSEMRIVKEMKNPYYKGAKADLLARHISYNSSYFDQGGKIDNDLLIATYICVSKSASDVVKKVMEMSNYNALMLPSCCGRKDIFDDSMNYHIFNELTCIVERNRERGFSRITTQKLLHKLLYACGNDFILNNPQLLVTVAKTIRTLEEYRLFVGDLMKFYLPMGQELTAVLVRKLINLSPTEDKKWLWGKVCGRVKALAEYEHCHQGTDCHAFKAGYLLLMQESAIDFKHYWAGQELHLKEPKTENVVRQILSCRFFDRVNAVMAIESIPLRCEVLLRLYVNNPDINYKEKGAIRDKMNLTFGELSKTLNGPDAVNIQINSIIKIFTIMTKKDIKIQKELDQPMLLGLVNFYRLQKDNESLGYYYNSNVAYVLNRISNICDKNKNEKYVKIFYGLFTNNKATGKAYMTCEVETLMSAL